MWAWGDHGHMFMPDCNTVLMKLNARIKDIHQRATANKMMLNAAKHWFFILHQDFHNSHFQSFPSRLVMWNHSTKARNLCAVMDEHLHVSPKAHVSTLYAALKLLSSKDVLNLENNDPHKYTWKLFSFPWPSWTNMICHFVEAVVWLPKMADHHSSQSIWKTSQFLGSLLPWHVKNSEIKFWIVYQLVVSKLAKLKTWFSRKRHILLLFWPFVKLLTIWLKLENNFPQKYTWKSFVFSCNPLEL